jgi:hypothetical protein
MKTRNSGVLADFVKYCQEHPDERFWQALRNWSGYYAIMALSRSYKGVTGGHATTQHDTFYIEGKRHES